MSELKPCPFCGEMPTLEQYNNGMWWIKCENPKCRIAPFTDMNKSRAVIVREWNRRSEKMDIVIALLLALISAQLFVIIESLLDKEE